jgi:glycosyltransferase involved in cell wall biosynthesis
MTKVYGLIVIKNEADRYLDSCLNWMSKFFDEIFIYDDQSSDNSIEIAKNYGKVMVRPDNVSSFIEDESKFRFAAWSSFEEILNPIPGEWIFSFDADEFIVNGNNIQKAINYAKQKNFVGISIPFPEIFDIIDNIPYIRIDGFWNKIRGPRLFEYRNNGKWNTKSMGCGSEPTYVAAGPISQMNFDIHVLHYGYANKNDRDEKWNRYSNLSFHGHNDSHIKSIIESPTLKPWTGDIPEVKYGQ